MAIRCPPPPRPALAGLAGHCVLALAVLSACGGSSTSDRPIPPAGIRATIPADFPEAEARVLRTLAFSVDDLPSGFELQYEDASREDAALMYVAHYFNAELDEQDLLKGGPATADVVVLISSTVSDAEQLFSSMASMSDEQIVDYTQQQQHWSADPELAALMEQVDVTARRIDVGAVPMPSAGWLTIETIRERQSGDEIAFYDLAVVLRRGRVVAIADLGSTQEEPDPVDIAKLANELAARASVLQ